jgi:hypothetical protein
MYRVESVVTKNYCFCKNEAIGQFQIFSEENECKDKNCKSVPYYACEQHKNQTDKIVHSCSKCTHQWERDNSKFVICVVGAPESYICKICKKERVYQPQRIPTYTWV